ncbi:phosphopentomutase [bacterium]|nr:phosphopentomutase [bacterium]
MAENTTKRLFLVILDGVGIGEAPDASSYGDVGSDTLGNLSRAVDGFRLPNLERLGLGNIATLEGMQRISHPTGFYGKMEPRSAGKDSITGHWEICGVKLDKPFPVFPNGFPYEVISLVENVSNRGVIGNEVASGTEIMARLGSEHVKTGSLILYTSADSVLQLLAHEEVVPLSELYRICEEIHQVLKPEHRVARVIARPFLGKDGEFVRTPNRKDFALEPPGVTILDKLCEENIPVAGIGKVDTLFAGRGFSSAQHTKGNSHGMKLLLESIQNREEGLVFCNLIDFDMEWGHRNDVAGFNKGLEAFDEFLPTMLNAAQPEDVFIVTADHGNDPTTPSTDHSREYVPLLAWKGKGGQTGDSLGERKGFSDIAATIADYFDISWAGIGNSFYSELNSID